MRATVGDATTRPWQAVLLVVLQPVRVEAVPAEDLALPGFVFRDAPSALVLRGRQCTTKALNQPALLSLKPLALGLRIALLL